MRVGHLPPALQFGRLQTELTATNMYLFAPTLMPYPRKLTQAPPVGVALGRAGT